MTPEYRLVDNVACHRFEFRSSVGRAVGERELPRVEYVVAPHDVVYLTHTWVPVELEGRGVAAALVGAVFGELERRGWRIVPVCPYIVAYLQRHSEWERLVVDGVSE